MVALQGITLDVGAGEIVALVGDNGAGKSTVVNCVAGVHPPTSGQILVEDEPVRFTGPLDARRLGIDVVFQDLALASAQPVYMNMFLGRELVTGPLRRLNRGAMVTQTQTLLEELDVRIDDPRQAVRELSLARLVLPQQGEPRARLGSLARIDPAPAR